MLDPCGMNEFRYYLLRFLLGASRSRSSRTLRPRSRVSQLAEGHMTSGSEYTDSEDDTENMTRNVVHVVSPIIHV